jgi:hypothetical protein
MAECSNCTSIPGIWSGICMMFYLHHDYRAKSTLFNV